MIGSEDLFGSFGTRPDDAQARTEADLAGIRNRDEQAFERLWLRSRPALEILLAGKFRKSLEPALRSRLDDEIDDILQEVAVVAWGKLPAFEYRGPGSLIAWLLTLALRIGNHRVEYWRTGKRSVGRTFELDPAPGMSTKSGVQELRGPWRTPSSEARAREDRQRIAKVLAELSDRHHQLVMLRFFAGADWNEVAQEIGGASGEAVKKECYRSVLPAIAAALAAMEGGGPDDSGAAGGGAQVQPEA